MSQAAIFAATSIPIDLMRAIYGLSTAGSADDWPAKARKFVDILLQGSRP
jgi:hypothetical protein